MTARASSKHHVGAPSGVEDDVCKALWPAITFVGRTGPGWCSAGAVALGVSACGWVFCFIGETCQIGVPFFNDTFPASHLPLCSWPPAFAGLLCSASTSFSGLLTGPRHTVEHSQPPLLQPCARGVRHKGITVPSTTTPGLPAMLISQPICQPAWLLMVDSWWVGPLAYGGLVRVLMALRGYSS
jgi:hypothetical protein